MTKLIKTIIIQVILLSIFLLRCHATSITNENLFIVKDIDVFNDFGTVAESKKIALDGAKEEAMSVLLNRIAMYKQSNKFNNIIKNDNPNLVTSYIIKNERITSHSYSANVNVQFSPDAIKSLLANHGINFADKIYDTCLIIPFYSNVSGNLAVKWTKFSPYQLGLVQPIIIRDDFEDIISLDTDKLMAYEYANFEGLLKKYGAKDIMLIEYTKKDEEMNVKIKFITSKSIYSKNYIFRKSFEDEDIDEMHKKIINAILLSLDSWWKGNKNIWN